MLNIGNFKVSTKYPIFDVTDYLYQKNKMCMHLEDIDNELWYVIKMGIPEQGENSTAADVRFTQLDSQAKTSFVFI